MRRNVRCAESTRVCGIAMNLKRAVPALIVVIVSAALAYLWSFTPPSPRTALNNVRVLELSKWGNGSRCLQTKLQLRAKRPVHVRPSSPAAVLHAGIAFLKAQTRPEGRTSLCKHMSDLAHQVGNAAKGLSTGPGPHLRCQIMSHARPIPCARCPH